MKITFYGVRGSIPTSTKQTTRYGGNTSCVYVEAYEQVLIFDAGTGIRKLGDELFTDKRDIHLFLSHYHWDHIQGFPFFRPIYQCGRTLYLHAEHLPDQHAYAIVEQMDAPYFPVSWQGLPSKIKAIPASRCAESGLDKIHVTACPINHPDGGAGYRLDTDDGSFAYVTDNELEPPGKANSSWQQWVDFLQNVDLLIHDSMYLDEDLPRVKGWGHSLVSQSLRLARDAGVANLVLFHHDPERTDDQLDQILKDSQQWMQEQGCHCKVTIAREGDEYQLLGNEVELQP